MALTVLNLRYEPSVARLTPAAMRRHQPSVTVSHHAPVLIRRAEVPYWQHRGWTRTGNRYRGTYQTAYGSFTGCVEDQAGQVQYWIHQPPQELRSSGHWACFQKRSDGWYSIHMRIPPKDIGSGILTVERLIAEAFQQAGRKHV